MKRADTIKVVEEASNQKRPENKETKPSLFAIVKKSMVITEEEKNVNELQFSRQPTIIKEVRKD